jgi:DnaJ-class molecular chaperone
MDADQPDKDDPAICPACNGSGYGVADQYCGFCGGSGGVPVWVAERFLANQEQPQ